MKKENLDKLASDLQALGAESLLNDEQKGRMLLKIEGAARLSDKLVQMAEEKYLSDGLRHRMLQAIRQTIEERGSQPFWQSWWLFRNWRSSVATFLIALFGLSIVVVSPFELRTTRASKWTFLTEVKGEVFVNRNGRTMSVDKNFVLEEGDLIFTRSDSFVTVRYLDDSVTRLGDNTSLEIKRLYVRPDNAVETEVELQLISGQIWASVYNLIDEDAHFAVETDTALANVSSKAAFEISSENSVTTLAVFDNVVDLSDKQGSKQVQPVLSGFKAEVKMTEQPASGKVKLATITVAKNINEDDWAKLNLGLDKQHQKLLKDENIQLAANSTALDESLVGTIADWKDGTKALFANADIEKARQKFLSVQLGFMKAQKLLQANDAQSRREATPLILQYKTGVKEIMADYQNLRAKDQGQADKLFSWMKEEIDLQRKSFSLILPGDKLFIAKEALSDAASNFAQDSAQKTEFYLANSKNRLIEMQGMIDNGDITGAEGALRSYVNGLNELVANVEKVDVAKLQGSLFNLLNEQTDQVKLLASIEQKLKNKTLTDLAEAVHKVKLESVTKLVAVVKTYYNNGIPMLMVMDLKNTVITYLGREDGVVRSRMIQDLELVLQNYPEYRSVKHPQINRSAIDGQQSEIIIEVQSTEEVALHSAAEEQLDSGEEQP